jgi:hypothetical protein
MNTNNSVHFINIESFFIQFYPILNRHKKITGDMILTGFNKQPYTVYFLHRSAQNLEAMTSQWPCWADETQLLFALNLEQFS